MHVWFLQAIIKINCSELQKIETEFLYFMNFYQNKTGFFFSFSAFIAPFFSLYFIEGWIMMLMLRGWGEQGKLFPVRTFSYEIRFCEARSNTRRNDTAHLPEVSFPHFTHGQLMPRKMKSLMKVTSQLGKEQGQGSMFSRLLVQGSCHLERTMVGQRLS